MRLSDIVMDTFAAESGVLRAHAARDGEATRGGAHADAAAVFAHDAGLRVEAGARTLLAGLAAGRCAQDLARGPPAAAEGRAGRYDRRPPASRRRHRAGARVPVQLRAVT